MLKVYGLFVSYHLSNTLAVFIPWTLHSRAIFLPKITCDCGMIGLGVLRLTCPTIGKIY
jgi:hypothetical protein